MAFSHGALHECHHSKYHINDNTEKKSETWKIYVANLYSTFYKLDKNMQKYLKMYTISLFYKKYINKMHIYIYIYLFISIL